MALTTTWWLWRRAEAAAPAPAATVTVAGSFKESGRNEGPAPVVEEVGVGEPDPRPIGSAVALVAESSPAETRPESVAPPVPAPARSGPSPAAAVAAYRADPAAYVAVSDSRRAWLTAAAGPDVPVLSVVGSSGMTVASGACVPLRLRAAPLAPVSFVTLGGGQFSNGADAITVPSDADGIAEALFHATPDAVAFVQISAACPLCVGQAGFTIEIGSAIEESP